VLVGPHAAVRADVASLDRDRIERWRRERCKVRVRAYLGVAVEAVVDAAAAAVQRVASRRRVAVELLERRTERGCRQSRSLRKSLPA
jgi:hypothetical protein